MNGIKDFLTVDSLGNYDRENNPQGLTVLDLLPSGVFWSRSGQKHKIESSEKLISKLLVGDVGIAVVVPPFNKKENKAFILEPDGSVMWDVSNGAASFVVGGVFSDVYYMSGELYFFSI